MKILIVHDNRDQLMEFTETLEKNGHSVLIVSSIKQGLALVNNDLWLDLIIISIAEIDCAALNLIRHTKASRRLRWIPYIVASREWNSDMVRLCRQLGAEELLGLPCSEELLLAKIAGLQGSGKRVILVVENDSSVMRHMKNILEIERFRVICTAEAADAMEIVMRREVHLVLCEVMLPNNSGLPLLSALKKWKKSLPVILVAGQTDSYRKAENIALEADGCPSKPFKNIELANQIRKFLG